MSTPITTSFDPYVSRVSFLAALKWEGGTPDETYKKVVDVVGSDYSPLKDGVETHSVAGLGPIKKRGETTPFEYDAPGPGLTKKSYYQNYALAVYFTENLLMNAQYGVVEKVVSDIRHGYDLARNLEVAALFDDAFTGSLYTGPDNLPIISSAHTFPGSATRTNTLAAPSGLSYTGVQSLLTVMKRQKTVRGYARPALRAGQRLIVMVPPEMEFEAYKIFSREAGLNPDTNTNAVNVLRNGNHTYEILVNPYLTSTTQWFILNPDDKGIKLVDKQPFTPDTFRDPFLKGVQHDGRAMWTIHVEDSFNVYGAAA